MPRNKSQPCPWTKKIGRDLTLILTAKEGPYHEIKTETESLYFLTNQVKAAMETLYFLINPLLISTSTAIHSIWSAA